MKTLPVVLTLLVLAAKAAGQEWLDTVSDSLSLRTTNGFFRSDFSGLLDLEGYYVDQRPPGLLFEDESFFNPRLSLFLDTWVGQHFYSFVQVRLDRGFDPGEKDNDLRADEYLVRWTPWNDSRVNLQFGKFATVVGSWVKRHYSWDNPLITSPLPYENITIASDDDIPTSPAVFLSRRSLPDDKADWLPMIWGPNYTTGWEVFGTIGKIDYAVDLKNTAISSPPYTWELSDTLWHYPSVSGRLGYRPSAAWTHGVSFSVGPYLSPDAGGALPPGKRVSDYEQVTLGYDVSYAHRGWEWWGEVFLNRFPVPNVGNADMIAYYLEAKYKITTGLYAAARWNQELFGTVSNGTGGQDSWDNDMYRIDVALGYRFTRHLQSKLQYSFGHRNTSLQQGEQLVAAQLTLKF